MNNLFNLFKNNYLQTWKNIMVGFPKWRKLKLSLLGRMAAVKINILSNFLFEIILIIMEDQ